MNIHHLGTCGACAECAIIATGRARPEILHGGSAVLRRRDRAQFPEQQILYLLRRLKAEGQVSLQFASPQLAARFRFLLYGWRNFHRATDYRGLEPELALAAESFVATVDGPILTLYGDSWDWLEQALVDGRPLREWMRQMKET
jgi:hypothetical protein